MGNQAAYSFLFRVLAPFLALSVTLSRLWGKNKEPPALKSAEEFRGQAPAVLQWPVRARWNTESLCDLKRHSLSLQEAAPTQPARSRLTKPPAPQVSQLVLIQGETQIQTADHWCHL